MWVNYVLMFFVSKAQQCDSQPLLWRIYAVHQIAHHPQMLLILGFEGHRLGLRRGRISNCYLQTLFATHPSHVGAKTVLDCVFFLSFGPSIWKTRPSGVVTSCTFTTFLIFCLVYVARCSISQLRAFFVVAIDEAHKQNQHLTVLNYGISLLPFTLLKHVHFGFSKSIAECFNYIDVALHFEEYFGKHNVRISNPYTKSEQQHTVLKQLIDTRHKNNH